MTDLFANDPIFKVRHRDKRGRFATADRAAYDKAVSENRWLRLEVEKYKRMADACVGSSLAQDRIISEQKRIIADLRKELAQTKNSQKC